jgi:heme/copper-type cytochrome/quinol oxidase subunit 2
MQHALGLTGSAAIMFAITVALGVAGILALLMALFWPKRWRLHYRVEVAFVVLLFALAIYADVDSGRTYQAYEAALPDPVALSSTKGFDARQAGFDREVRVYAFQWGFIFFDQHGKASRNAVKVAPGEKVLFNIMSNDVIHGLNIPAARLTTELDPGGVRSVWIRAPNAPGKYLIQCLNYCGLGHAQMKAWLVVEGADRPDAGAKPHG